MNDVFIEQIVARKKTAATYLKQIGIVFGVLVLNVAVLVIGFLRIIFPVTLAVSCWALWTFLRNFNVEFEYSLTNGELDVDKILGQRKREHVLTVRIRSFDILAPVNEEYSREYSSQAIGSRVDASIGEKSEGRWFARYTSEAGVDTLLIFNPNDRLLAAMGKLLRNNKFKGELPPEPEETE